MNKIDLHGWLPISISQFTAEPLVDWCRFGTRRFTESFYNDTLQNAMRDPFNLVFRHQTPLDTLLDWQQQSPGMQPSGFIYHMSRCGSTLVSQMLAALPDHIVLSEPPPVDAILRTDRRGATDEQRISWLRAWMSAMGQPLNGEQRLYIKFDAWHTFDLPLLRRAFPNTPWIFLYRNPVEVMVSSMKNPGMQFVQGMVGINAVQIPFGDGQMTHAEYMAHMLAQLLSAVLEHLRPLGGRAVDYSSLPKSVITDIVPHFDLALTTDQIAAMNEKTQFHAKQPYASFEPDAQRKQQEAGDDVRELCATFLDPLYAQLRAL